MTLNLGATGFTYGHKMAALAEEFPIAVITMWSVGGFALGMIVGAVLMIGFSYSTGRIAIVKIKKST